MYATAQTRIAKTPDSTRINRGNIAMLIRAKDLTGYSLNSKNGEIGKVKEFYFDDRHWIVRYLVAETGNWLDERRVLLSPYALLAVNQKTKQVSVNLTKKQIENSPSLDTDKPVSKQYEQSYYGYYGWPEYWSGSFAWGNTPFIITDPKKRPATNSGGKAWDPDLRSTLGVQGYHIQAMDGEVGHVKDYLIDDETWEIKYMIIDTQNWIPGRTVLISPKSIDRISWDELKVFVKLSRDAIKDSPEYLENIPVTREYETMLRGQYNLQEK